MSSAELTRNKRPDPPDVVDAGVDDAVGGTHDPERSSPDRRMKRVKRRLPIMIEGEDRHLPTLLGPVAREKRRDFLRAARPEGRDDKPETHSCRIGCFDSIDRSTVGLGQGGPAVILGCLGGRGRRHA